MTTRPEPLEIAAALMACAGKYVEFRYNPQFPPRKKTPSVVQKEADEKRVGPLDEVKGFFDHELTTIRQTKDGNWTITLHTMNRRKATEDGVYSQYGYNKDEYLPRCYRMEGIRLDTLLVATHKGKKLVMPDASIAVQNTANYLDDMELRRAGPSQ